MQSPNTARFTRTFALVLFSTFFTFLSLSSYAEEKHALVIGNNNYSFGPLKNPVNDARSISQTLRLKGLGFKVTELHNRSRKQMINAVRQFGQSVRPGSVAVVYFSGHGAQYRGENYLFPTDFNTQYENELPVEAISTSFLMNSLSRNHSGLNILIFDACRDNPLQKQFKNVTRGLARVDNAPPNTYSLFATRPGHVASDNSRGNNGLFTKYLIQFMKKPGLDLGSLMIETRKRVMAASNNRQVPYESGALIRKFCFAGCNEKIANNQNTASVAQQAQRSPTSRPTASSIISHSHQGRNHKHKLPASGIKHHHGQPVAQKPRTQAVRAQPARQPKPVKPSSNHREPRMLLIKGGSFNMGSPLSEEERDGHEKQHRVDVKTFHLAMTEVTLGEFKRFAQAENYRVEAAGCRHFKGGKWVINKGLNWRSPGFKQADNHPVTCVSADDADAYAKWLSKSTGKRYKLPTEAQWEYAARGGTQTARYWGDDPKLACQHANSGDLAAKREYSAMKAHDCNDGMIHTAVVSRYKPNSFGLRDMLGNVTEWTCSAYDKNYFSTERRCTPIGSRAQRVLRGGSWESPPWDVRSADRLKMSPNYRTNVVGFRLARTP